MVLDAILKLFTLAWSALDMGDLTLPRLPKQPKCASSNRSLVAHTHRGVDAEYVRRHLTLPFFSKQPQRLSPSPSLVAHMMRIVDMDHRWVPLTLPHLMRQPSTVLETERVWHALIAALMLTTFGFSSRTLTHQSAQMYSPISTPCCMHEAQR